MNALVLTLFLCAVLGISTAYWLTANNGNDPYDGYFDDDQETDYSSSYKRSVSGSSTKNLCIPWRSPCTHDSKLLEKYDFLRCCGRSTCKCTLWGNNCRCESRIGG